MLILEKYAVYMQYLLVLSVEMCEVESPLHVLLSPLSSQEVIVINNLVCITLE